MSRPWLVVSRVGVVQSCVSGVKGTRPNVTTRGRRVRHPSRHSLRFEDSVLRPSRFLEYRVTALTLRVFGLVLAGEVFLRFGRVLVGHRISVSFRVLRVLNGHVPIMLLLGGGVFGAAGRVGNGVVGESL